MDYKVYFFVPPYINILIYFSRKSIKEIKKLIILHMIYVI